MKAHLPMTSAMLALTKFNVDTLRAALSTFESSLGDELKRLEDRVEEGVQGIPAEDQADYYQRFEDEHWELRDVMPALLRRMVFTSAYSLLEHRMNAACEGLRRDLKLTLQLREIQGDGIQRARTYLQKVGGLLFPDDPHWQRLTLYNKMRNAFTHADGVLKKGDPNSDTIRAQAKVLGTYTVDNHQRVILGKGFCFEALDCVEAFLDQLVVAVGERFTPRVKDT